MTSNGKILNYKVVNLVESYNFHIKFTSIRVQTKNYKFLKTNRTLTVVAHSSNRCYSTARVRNRPVRLAYQPPANSTFLSERISH
jgi:hypothetical protein